jgi:hypothetical protein
MSLVEMLKGVKKGDKVIVQKMDDAIEGILTKKGKYEITIKYNYWNGLFDEDIRTYNIQFIKSIIKMPDDHITKWKVCKICNNKIKRYERSPKGPQICSEC